MSRTIFATGQLTAVFQDPHSCTRIEGFVRLRGFIRSDDETGLEHWHVEFVHSGERTVRRFNPIMHNRRKEQHAPSVSTVRRVA